MKPLYRAVIGLLAFVATLCAASAVEPTWNFAVQVSATVQTSPLQIALSWPQDTTATPVSYTVYRKAPSATAWSSGTTLPGTATSFVDNTVVAGTAYEYQIVKNSGSYTGYGYIQAGVNVPLVENRGSVVLIVDNTHAAALANELARLQQDLAGDGWTVLRHDVGRNDSVTSVKALIRADYNADPTRVKAVFLFGHVPVPYSGQLNPDGHPDHVGAWPADVYYGDMDGNWTDSQINYRQTLNTDPADAARLSNLPGDGKFDQTTIPSAVELQVGRVDLANLPGRTTWGGPATFPDELALLRQYLKKDHDFRHHVMTVQRRAIVGDYFGARNGEAFAASGFRSFAPLVGADKITNLNVQYNDARGVWIPTLANNDYLLAYGAGAGSYQGISGLGSVGQYNDTDTVELVNNDIHAVFTLLFGSWFGDWDHEENILRSVLATPTNGLAAAWSGRPHWFLHPMGLGETIGYTARLAQNNAGLYQNQSNSAANRIHVALMGDPTLRLDPVAPAGNLTGVLAGNSVTLSWGASSDASVWYHVYRAPTANGPFTRLTSLPMTLTTFLDPSASAGAVYMVRAVKLETTPSGSYYNASQGKFWTVGGTAPADTTPPAPPPPTTSPTVPPPPPPPTQGTGTALWFDDALPAGASGFGSGGDGWNWVTSSPAPWSGSKAHQSNLAAGVHEHYFNWAGSTLSVGPDDVLFTYVYLDPANPPTEIMLGWMADNWEHRAYWGANTISYGTNGTASRRYMGPLPPAGQWVRLDIPADEVGLEGQTVTGMSFIQFGGRATWDFTGKADTAPAPSSVTVMANDSIATIGTADNAEVVFARTGDTSSALTVNYSLGGSAVKWLDYRRPEGDMPDSVTIPAGVSSKSMTVVGMGNATNASPATAVFALAADPAYTVGTASSATLTLRSPSAPIPAEPAPTPSPTGGTVWFDDALPAGAGGSATGGDSWNWTGSSPAPYSGTRAHTSNLSAGVREHYFNWANNGLALNTGDVLFTYVYLDPANPPTEIMLGWMADNWEHRAYWGANTINYGTNGTASRRSMGALPAAGQWVRLEVPASAVGLEGKTATGMSFVLFGGRATWDATGKGTEAIAIPSQPSVTIAATDGSATIGTADSATLTFTRSGSTASAITVNYTLGGSAVKWVDYRRAEGDMPISVTIPAGAASTTLDIIATDNATNASPATAVFKLAGDPAYTVGSAGSATVTLLGSASGNYGSGSGSGSGSGTIQPPTNPPSGKYDLSSIPAASEVDYTSLAVPEVDSHVLHVLSPTTVELVRVNRKMPDPAPIDSWNFVDAAGNLNAPAASKFNVTVNGQSVAVQQVGFKRRPLYAPLKFRDLLVTNSLILTLATPVSEGQSVEVKNPDASLWPATMQFAATAHPLRYSPAIHVNQEGYVPGWPKKASVGQYLGTLGEMNVDDPVFSIVSTVSGAVVFNGSLTSRIDTGWNYSPAHYQKVYEADFTSLDQPGEYMLVVPGLGASLPFVIDEGIGMNFARTYALGIYGQRSGTSNDMPFTRFTHAPSHMAPAGVPSTVANFGFTWTTIAMYANTINTNNPAQIAPRLTSPANQLYPFVNQGTVEVSGGHHDAGDYSKYTINVASLVHLLMFAVDSIPGVASLDNLGLPESADGISDIMQEAKWESDFLAKLQDADGGFYFLVYPKNSEYESWSLPENGDAQVVWPKTTSATAAAVAALAETASSPRFKQAYPAEAALYLQKAKLGWQFLTNAIARYGKAGAYQKITHYGDDFTHDDELAWAAAAMFVATGDPAYQQTLKSWFEPTSTDNLRWGWWHAYMGFGNAERTYAFAVRSGRLAPGQMDAAYLAKCEAELMAAGNDALTWSQQSAYGTSFPTESKRVQGAGWYFSGEQTFDITVANQIAARPEYLDAILRNMNYEAGNNPVNVSYVTGLGWKRPQEIVSQYAQNDRHLLPPNGIPLGNIQTGPVFTGTYGTELAALTFPRDNAAAPTPFYDRWSDTFNVTTEFVTVAQARALTTYAYLGALTPTASQPWRSAAGQITGLPASVAENESVTATLQIPGMDLSTARIVWEAKDQEAAYGPTFTFKPVSYGDQWVEAEAQWADGRRVVAAGTFFANNGLPTITVAATDATATLGNASDTATWTFTRAGDASSAMTVNFNLAGSAMKWVDYRRPQGDMPQVVTFPAGATTATITIYAVANSSGANPETVALTLAAGAGYNVGTPAAATVTIR